MASTRAIKHRIRSINSTKQITKAMNLVSASKLQKAKANLETARPFYEMTKAAIASIIGGSKGIRHKYIAKPQEASGAAQGNTGSTGIILLTADRGLCGGYNVNVCKEALKLVNQFGNEQMIIVGSKGRDYFRRRKKKIVRFYSGISDKPFYEDALEILNLAVDMYDRGEISQLYLVYTEFKSSLSQVPKAAKLLPMEPADFAAEAAGTSGAAGATGAAKPAKAMNYEPDEATVLNYVIPKYLSTYIFGAMVEAATCEQGSRMVSMDTATSNADDIIGALTLKYNRARQGAITQEINEIVSGANALS